MKNIIFKGDGVDRDGVRKLHAETNAVRKGQNRQPMGRLAFAAVLVSHVNSMTVSDSNDGHRKPSRHSKTLATAVEQLTKKKPDPAQPLEEARPE